MRGPALSIDGEIGYTGRRKEGAPIMPTLKPEPPAKSDGELSLSDLDEVSGGVPSGPDVCVRPTQPAPIPMPYPNVGDSGKTISDLLKDAGFD